MNLGPEGKLLLADPQPLPMLPHVGAESLPQLVGGREAQFPAEAQAFRSPNADDEEAE